MDVAAAIDFAGLTVTIQIADGTYTGTVMVPVCVGQKAPSNLLLFGNPTNPENVIVSVTGSTSILVTSNAMCRLQAFEIRNATSGQGVAVSGTGAYCEIHTGMRFGAVSGAMINVVRGANCVATGNYTVAGNAARRIWATDLGVYVESFRTITYSGTPAFSSANVDVLTGGVVSSAASTQSGSATGKRYQANVNGMISTGGGGANFYPGDVAGTEGTTGGRYS